MARQCIFCPRAATTYEHVVPAWLPRHLGLSGFILNRRRGKEGETRKVDGPFGRIRARIFCADCQRHFAGLEAEVKPLLLPMIDGRPARLYRYWEQRYIALWATKTAYASLARENQPLPRKKSGTGSGTRRSLHLGRSCSRLRMRVARFGSYMSRGGGPTYRPRSRMSRQTHTPWQWFLAASRSRSSVS